MSSSGKNKELRAVLAGSEEFLRRVHAAVPLSMRQELGLHLESCNLAEAKQYVVANRPDLLLVEIGYTTTPRDTLWIHHLLSDIRERFDTSVYIVPVVVDPSKFLFAGNLLFASSTSLEDSKLIDNFLIAAPGGLPRTLGLGEQIHNLLEHLRENFACLQAPEESLPTLWAPGWAPTMCAPESRNAWLRWLPRYAKYVNENPLVVGPTGSGKTRFAHALHSLSGRPGPFVSITPRDFSSMELVQAELFGAVAGAYTGAVEKWGLVKQAEKGTLFVDELQSIDTDLQGKLITFIENKTYRRVGEAQTNHADVRFIFASNRSLEDLVASGLLRDDFAYRLERLSLNLPPLSERRLDIPAGICFALAKVVRERGLLNDAPIESLNLIHGLTAEAYRRLYCAPWPGNLRQLENTVAKLIDLASIRELKLIDLECVEEGFNGILGQNEADANNILGTAAYETFNHANENGFTSLEDCRVFLGEQARALALESASGNTAKAAALLSEPESRIKIYQRTREAK